MKSIITSLTIFFTINAYSQSIETNVVPFKELMIGPGISIELIKSNEEKIHLVSNSPLIQDLMIEEGEDALKIYFDYKDFSFSDDDSSPAHGKYSLENTPYQGVKVYGKIYYKHLESIDFRGDDKLFAKDDIEAEDFLLKIYGDSEVKLAAIYGYSLKLKAYGENEISILDGRVDKMKINSYGENDIYTSGLKSEELKIVSFGESDMEVCAAESLNVKVIGEGSIRYAGDPHVKEFNLGEASVSRLP